MSEMNEKIIFDFKIINGNQILITTNTEWSCFVNGNFTLSDYSGDGNSTIDIIVPQSVQYINGYVVFVVGSFHCPSKFTLELNNIENKDFFVVTPLNVVFNKKSDSIRISVSSSKDWTIENNSSNVITQNKTDNSFYIASNSDSDYETTIKVVSGNKSQIITIRQKTEIIDDTCYLNVFKSPTNENASVFQITVTSKKGNSFSSYWVESKPNNLNIQDNGLGTINCNVIDLFSDCIGDIIIKNECGLSKTISIKYLKKVETDDVFYLSYNNNNNNKYTEVNIAYDKHAFSWNGNNIDLPYNENYTFNVVSLDSNDNLVNWRVKSYNNERIEVSNTQNKLTLKLLDFTKTNYTESVVLENNMNKIIVLNFNVVDGLIEVSEFVFQIGLKESNKSKKVTIGYDINGITVYIDSYKTLSTNPNIKWICNGTDEIINYNVTPMNDIGGNNNVVKITALEDVLNNLDDDYVGVVTFQQLETYETITVEISHKAVVKEWVEKSHEITAMTISPSVVTVDACENQKSEYISVIGFFKITEEFRDAAGNIYAERDRYEERDITYTVDLNDPSRDLKIIKDENGNGIYVVSVTSNGYGNSNRVVDFKVSSGGFEGIITATQLTATQSEIFILNRIEVKQVNFELNPTEFDRLGGISSANAFADVTYYSALVDSCGNVNKNTEQAVNDIITTGLTLRQTNTVDGFTIQSNHSEIKVAEIPWIYDFKTVEVIEELFFPPKDTVDQYATIYTHKGCDERIGDFVVDFEMEKDGKTASGTSDKISIKEKGDNQPLNYTLVSKPTWAIVNQSSIGSDFMSTITVNAEKNTVNEERSGEIVFRQIESGKEIRIKIRQEARGLIPIPDFNYLVLRYYWTEEDGRDLDTVTVFINTGIVEKSVDPETGVVKEMKVDDSPVGYGHTTHNPLTGLTGNVYLEFAGDNTENGNECVYINFLEICNESNVEELPEEIYLDLYGNWFGEIINGSIDVEISAYKGGTMTKDEANYNFVNDGGEVMFQNRVSTSVNTQGSGLDEEYKTEYTYIGRVTYFKENQSAILQLIGGE